jgi:hypothetical protein
MRVALGIAVSSDMLGVTLFRIFPRPCFTWSCAGRWRGTVRQRAEASGRDSRKPGQCGRSPRRAGTASSGPWEFVAVTDPLAIDPSSRSRHRTSRSVGRVPGRLVSWFSSSSRPQATGRFLRLQFWAWPINVAVLFPSPWKTRCANQPSPRTVNNQFKRGSSPSERIFAGG